METRNEGSTCFRKWAASWPISVCTYRWGLILSAIREMHVETSDMQMDSRQVRMWVPSMLLEGCLCLLYCALHLGMDGPPPLVCSPDDRRPGPFQLLAIMNRAAVDVCAQVSV